jgi:hypothetical protein
VELVRLLSGLNCQKKLEVQRISVLGGRDISGHPDLSRHISKGVYAKYITLFLFAKYDNSNRNHTLFT